MFLGWPQYIWQFNQEHHGLALTWGLTHLRNLEQPCDPEETKKEAQERLAAERKAYQDEAHARAHQQARRAREAHVLGVYVSTMHGQLVFPSRSGCGRNRT